MTSEAYKSGTGERIYLQYLPLCVLFKPSWTTSPPIPGVPAGFYPMFPRTDQFSITTSLAEGTVRVHHAQYDLISAYAFTHEKSQGQTLAPVICDISMPARPSMKIEGLYVCLSRSSGRQTVRILRPFDERIIKKLRAGPTEALRLDNQLLKRQNQATKERFENGTRFVH
jgi:hypothetical protein